MSTSTYHHENLSAALVRAVLEPPYRQYPDRDALMSTVAAVGYRELAESLATVHPPPSTPGDLAAVPVAYVQFALRRPALFRVMFAEPCGRESAERVAATATISTHVSSIAQRAFAGTDREALSTLIWVLARARVPGPRQQMRLRRFRSRRGPRTRSGSPGSSAVGVPDVGGR